jgi:hypothetical protein
MGSQGSANIRGEGPQSLLLFQEWRENRRIGSLYFIAVFAIPNVLLWFIVVFSDSPQIPDVFDPTVHFEATRIGSIFLLI